jgi:broad specificity phosphatase PhoE
MTTFYICRHGQTENNKLARLSGWIDTPLTAEGEINAVTVSAKLRGLRFDKIVSSDLGRTFITAYIISRRLGYTAEIERRSALREINYGTLSNKPVAEYPATGSPEANATLQHDGGESLVMMQQRVVADVTQLAAGNLGKTILLVGHDGTINALRAVYSGEDIGVVDARAGNPHDIVLRMDWNDGRITALEEIGGGQAVL